MEAYLNRYCKFIKKATSGIPIDDTITFMDSDDFDSTEVLEAFKKIINIDKICDQVYNDRFLSDFEFLDKIATFLEYFSNLYSYAKNLIKNFDIYSSKTVQATSFVMKGSIMLFPHHRRYMETLLGYEYDSTAKEWTMTGELTRDRRRTLAAVCILTASGYRKIKEIEMECPSVRSSSSKDLELMEEDRNDGSELGSVNEEWVCERCTFVNDVMSANCAGCYGESQEKVPMEEDEQDGDDERDQEEEEEEEEREHVVTMDPVVSDCRRRHHHDEEEDEEEDEPLSRRWTCQYCDTINETLDRVCTVCEAQRLSQGEGRVIPPLSKLLERRLKEKKTSDVEGSRGMMYVDTFSMTKKPAPGQWKCPRCSFINDLHRRQCAACSEKRAHSASSRHHHQEEEKEEEEKKEEEVRPTGDTKSAWKCERCTFSNNIKQANCTACLEGRSIRKMKENEWRCQACTFINGDQFGSCLVCHKRRSRPESGIIRKSKSMDMKTPQVTMRERAPQDTRKEGAPQDTRRERAPQDTRKEGSPQRTRRSTYWRCDGCGTQNDTRGPLCAKCREPRKMIPTRNEKESKVIPRHSEMNTKSRPQSVGTHGSKTSLKTNNIPRDNTDRPGKQLKEKKVHHHDPKRQSQNLKKNEKMKSPFKGIFCCRRVRD